MGFPKMGVPQNRWFIMETPNRKRMIWGYPASAVFWRQLIEELGFHKDHQSGARRNQEIGTLEVVLHGTGLGKCRKCPMFFHITEIHWGFLISNRYMGMDQYLLIPFLVG